MTPTEEYYLKVRNKLDELGYFQPLSFDSVLLVEKLVEDLLDTKRNLQHYKNVAQQSMEACSELQVGVGPYKEDNAKLIKENNELRQKLLKAKEAVEETRLELRREIRNLEKERTLQDYLCSQHASKISQLQTELAQKSAKLADKNAKVKMHGSGHYKKKESAREDKELMLEKAQDKLNNLTKEITKLKSEQQELDEVIECLKNKVNARDTEIGRLTQLLTDGRPLMSRNQCPCCAPQVLDCRLLAKNKQLSDQLQESKLKQHEAMVRAMDFAERNQLLEEKRLPSARSDGSKKCCCAENANRICKLQEKLEERILQVDRLEQEVADLKKANCDIASDKLSVDKILEITIEDKKKMNDRINELLIIEHDLMLEIDRLKRTNAMQKSQLAELEARVTDSERMAEKDSDRTASAKPTAGQQRPIETRRPLPTKKVVLKATAAPVAPPKVTRPPVRRPAVRRPETDSSVLSSSLGPRHPSPPPVPRPASPGWKEQLMKERKQFEQQLEEMARQQAEHCAKFHPPACPQSAKSGKQPAKEMDAQWLMLERVQAERDYYHKEFTRLRDQLCNTPDHTTEATTGPTSPHQKLERLLSERDYYHKEMCRLLECANKTSQNNTACNELERQLSLKQDEVNILQGKLANLQHKLASQEENGGMWRKIKDKEDDIKSLSEKIKELEHQVLITSSKPNDDLIRKLNLKEEEILNLRERLKYTEKCNVSETQQPSMCELWRRLNSKEEEILILREKIRDLERNQVPLDLTQTNAELWRKLNFKEDELLRMQDKIRSLENELCEFSILKRKYNQKEEENLCLREQIREYQCNRCSSSGISQATLTKLEMERDSAKGDCMRLREENNAIRDDLQRLKEGQRCEQMRLDQAQKDFDNCVAQFEVERAGLCTQIKQLSEELRQFKDKVRELQSEAGEQRTRCNHLKMVNEQTDRELRTTQDLLQQTEVELTSALDRIQELNDEHKQHEWELKEARQEKMCIKANLSRLDQEKDSLLLKVDEKTEQNVRLEAELDSRDRRIASLESFIADLQKKLDVALDTAARSEQSSRQQSMETDRLRKELDKMERCRDNAIKENSRLQNDLAALTRDYQENSRALESSRREVEDLKLQLQGYVAEARRVNQMLEEKEAERMAMLEHFRSLTVESANLETNNHSLESEARSTKSCLREAQTRLQELESKLQEKRALCCSYEKQMKELTQQVAKLERKLDSRSRAESATRDLSRELETQKHCLSQKMEQLVHDKKELEEEVCQLREELCRLQEQLGKERKNSATLENVLAGARQETLQRTKDNGELRAQVNSLQSKLRDLQDKLEHGSEALRRCQTECKDYQGQVSELKREVTNERFERARVEENRRKCTCPLKGRCSCCVLVCGSLTSLTNSQHSLSYDESKNELKKSATCTCLRIPFPPVPSSTSFPKHSLMGSRPGPGPENTNHSQINSSQPDVSSESNPSSTS